MTEQPGIVRKWITAVRPFAYTATVLPVLLGLALSYSAGYRINLINFVLTLIGMICLHTAANLINDIIDFRRGLDKNITPVSGAVVRGWLTERQVLTAALIFLVSGCVTGLYLIMVAGWPILLLGFIGLFIVLGYTRDGLCLKYAGLGDIAVFLGLGVLPVFGTYWVQAQEFSWLPVLWGPVISFFTVGILHANNWRDIESDKQNACHTIAGKLGVRGAALYYHFLLLLPFIIVAIYVGINHLLGISVGAPVSALLVFLALPMIIKMLKVTPDTGMEFVMLDGRTAQAQFVFGILLVAGFFIDTAFLH